MKKFAIFLASTIFSLGILITGAYHAQPNLLTFIKKLSSGNSPQVLGTQSQIYISGNEGSPSGGIISQTSLEEPTISISSYDITGEVTVDIYKASQQEIISFLQYNDDGKRINPEISTENLEKVAGLNHSLNKSGSADKSRISLPISGKGIWLLKISSNQVTTEAILVRSNLGVISKEGNNEFIFWAQDISSGKSFPQVDIKTYSLKNQVNELASVSTNHEGVATTPISHQVDIALASYDGDIALIPINLTNIGSSWITNDRERQARFKEKVVLAKHFLFTDRPIYQPGDKIYFKVISREDDDARYSIPSGNAKINIYRGWGTDEVLYEKTLAISPQGSIDGEFILPETAKSGSYRIEIKTSNPTSEYYSESYGFTAATNFEVEYYRKPDYSLSINTNTRAIISGEKATFNIDGKYFSGQPLANQTVTYKISKSDYHEYSYYYPEIESNQDYYYGSWGSGHFDSGTALLDDKGQAEITLPAKLTEGASQVFSVEASYQDETGNQVFDRKNILVKSGTFSIFQKKYQTVRPNQQTSVPIILINNKPDSSIENINLTTHIAREYWTSQIVENQKYPQYTNQKEDLGDFKTTTNQDGEASIVFTTKDPGSYHLQVRGEDGLGNIIIKNIYVWVSDGQEFWPGNNNSQSISISLDNDTYEPTDSAQITIYSQAPNRDIFFSLDRGKVNRYQIVQLSGNAQTITLPLQQTDMPNIYATASTFSSENLESNYTNIPVSPKSKQLTVELSPQRNNYGPSDTVEVEVATYDNNHQPISGEVAVWAVDKAIYELSDNKLRNIFDTYWSERYASTSLANSLEGIMSFAAEMGGCFAGDTPISLPGDKSKPISDLKVGDEIITRTSENDSHPVKAKVTKIHQTTVDGYLIVNQELKITPNHILYVNQRWQQAANLQIGDTLINDQGQETTVDSIEWQKQNTQVYNLEVEKYHTFFAGGIWVHNQKGEAREVLEDTAYWNPTVRTNVDGKARITFKLPDNLTTWVIQAVAATADTKVGQSTQEIVVSKDIVVRPVTPNLIRTNDKLTISALVHNHTDQEEIFNVSLYTQFAQINEATKSGILIKPNSFEKIDWDLSSFSQADQARFTFEAIAQGDSTKIDTITTTIPIIKYGFYQKSAQTFFMNESGQETLKFNTQKQIDPEKSQLTLSLSPSLLGSLSPAVNYLVDYPYGCVEQTTSRFVPAVIVKSNPQLFESILFEKDVDKMIQKGVARLGSLQQSDGGWGWWSHNSSDHFITAYVLEYLLKAREEGIEVDPIIISQATGFFTQQNLDTLNQENKIVTLFALGLLNHPQSQAITDFTDKPDLAAMAVLHNTARGNRDPQSNGLNHLLSLAKTEGEGLFWEPGDRGRFSSSQSSTGFALRALLANNQDPETLAKLVTFLTRSRSGNYWSNTFGTAQVVRSLSQYSNNSNELNPDYSISIAHNQDKLGSISVNDYKQQINPIVQNISSNRESTININMQGRGNLYGTLQVDQFINDPDFQAESHGLKVNREYVNQKGDEYSIGVGDTVIVKISVEGFPENQNYGLIQDELPAGLVPININLKNEQTENGRYSYPSGYSHIEYTQNGVLMPLPYIPKGQTTFSYKARAILPGEFITPPARAEMMYAPELNGYSSSQKLVIDQKSKVIASKMLQKKVVNNIQKVKNFFNNFLKNKQLHLQMGTTALVVGSIYLVAYIVKTDKNSKEKPKDPFNTPPENEQE